MTHVGGYELGELLGRGGMGSVYRAVRRSSGGFSKPCVVKVLHASMHEQLELRAMFEQEARISALLNHPCIPQVFDSGVDGGTAFLVMEQIDGPTLQRCLQRHRQLKRPVPPAIAARLVAHVCEALSYAHALKDGDGQPLNLVHRDVSPDNIMVSVGGAVKLTDFGVMKIRDSAVKTQTGLTRGKVRYMSPEQLRAQPLGPQSDVHACGVVLCELLTLEHPWEGDSESALMLGISSNPARPARSLSPTLPPALADLIDRAVDRDLKKRLPSCDALRSGLEQYILSSGASVTAAELSRWLDSLDDATLEADPTWPVVPTPPQLTAKASMKKPLALGLAAFGVALLAGTLLLPGLRAKAAPLPPPPPPPPPALAVAEVPVPPPPPVVVSPEPAPPVPESTVQLDLLMATLRPTAKARPAAAKGAPVVELGTVQVRVRPWAVVHVDGKRVGESPLEELKLPIGKHTFRLINDELGKDVTATYQVVAGNQLFKFNLLGP